MLIYGHRGESVRAPENTLRAFELALETGVDGIELDVRATSDGVPIVIHDRRLDRTTNGAGNVDELTFDQVRQYDAGAGERVPSLDEALALIGGRAHLDIEFKQSGIERQVVDLLKQHSSVNWSASSFKWGVLKRLRSLDRSYDLWPLSDFVSDELLTAIRHLGATAAAVKHVSLNEETVSVLRSTNARIFGWTVNDVDEARRLDDLGIDMLCTDSPTMMIQALANAPAK